MCLRFVISLFLIPFSIPGWASTPVFLAPGEFKIQPAGPSTPVSVENGKVVAIKDLGKTIRITGKSPGHSLVKVGDQELLVTVVSSKTKSSIKSLQDFLQTRRGLKIEISNEGLVLITGRLLRMSDWQQLKKLSLEQGLTYTFKAMIPEALKPSTKKWLTEELHQLGLSETGLVLTPYPSLKLDPSYKTDLAHYQQQLQPYGLVAQIEPGQITQKPSVMLNLVLAEVDETFEQEMGILWGSEEGPGIYRTTVLPKFKLGELSAKLTLMESSGLGRILAKPQLLSRSGEKAEFHAGGEIPIQISGWGSQSVEWKKYGILMNFQPLADNHGRMSLTVESEVSIPDLNHAADQLPIFEINRVKSHFDLDKSRTVVISGLVRNSENNFRQGIPYLSRIPILGRLFGSPKYRQRKTELLIFVTPRVLRPSELDSIEPEMPFDSKNSH